MILSSYLFVYPTGSLVYLDGKGRVYEIIGFTMQGKSDPVFNMILIKDL